MLYAKFFENAKTYTDYGICFLNEIGKNMIY